MHGHASPVDKPLFTPGVFVLLALMGIAAIVAIYRFLFGLVAVTNLDDQYPWGIWIAIDVATGVALAAGGFTTAALAHIFHQHRYEVVVRPALQTALLGYTFVGLGLLVDLGRYYNIWHPAIMWQGNSVLFEVGMCVMTYQTVLYIEFVPLVCERFRGRVNLPGPLAVFNAVTERLLQLADRTLSKVMFLFVIAGVVLSCMHQSSLGALLLIAPYKVHPLWYTPILPLLFLLSAIAVGYPMVVLESMIASRTFGRKPEMHVLGPLARFVVILLGLYLIAKISDFVIRDAFRHLDPGGVATWMFLAEVLLGVVLPFAMLLSAKVRWTPRWLFVSCALIVLGVALNRINVFLVAYHPPYAKTSYFPAAGEVIITIGLIAGLIFVYRVAVTIFPVLPAGEGPGVVPAPDARR